MSASTELFERRLSDLFAYGPAMAAAFKRAGLGACLGCAMAEFETLADAVRHLAVDPNAVRAEIAPIAAAKRGGRKIK